MGLFPYDIFVFGIIIFSVIAFFRTPRGKGILGEWSVRFWMRGLRKKYKIIHNLTFTVDEKSVQVDHIVIGKNGVFVIETKNYVGRIYGSEKNHHWTQVLAYGKVKHKLFNPIKQNRGHIYALNKALPEHQDIPFQSIIVFTLKSKLFVDATTPIVSPIRLKRTIKRTKAKRTLSENEIESIAERLQTLKQENNVSLRKHVKSIRRRQEGIKNDICPRCGGKLIEKQGKYGTFMAFLTYPEGKF